MEENALYRYFYITKLGESGSITRDIEDKYYEENGDYIKAESELMRKYNIVRYFIFRNHLRYIKACRRLQEEDPKNSLDMLATFKDDVIPDGFTTIDLGDGKEKAAKELKGLNMYKIDLRTKTGKKIFDEFLELKGFTAGRELSLGDFVAKSFNLLYKFVPSYNEESKEIYQTIMTQITSGWLAAVPRCSFTDTNELRGLPDDYMPEPPVSEISKEEYFTRIRDAGQKGKKKSKAKRGGAAVKKTTKKPLQLKLNIAACN